LSFVHFPDSLQQGGDGVLVLLDRGELNATRESEVGYPVAKGFDVVERDLLVTRGVPGRPVMSQIPCPVLRVSVQARAMYFKLLIGQLDEAEGAD